MRKSWKSENSEKSQCEYSHCAWEPSGFDRLSTVILSRIVSCGPTQTTPSDIRSSRVNDSKLFLIIECSDTERISIFQAESSYPCKASSFRRFSNQSITSLSVTGILRLPLPDRCAWLPRAGPGLTWKDEPTIQWPVQTGSRMAGKEEPIWICMKGKTASPHLHCELVQRSK
jgi:hypothetical protein